MALPTFNPDPKPSPGGSHNPKVSLRTAEFGDGFTQSSPAGLNHVREIISLKWDGVTEMQMRALRDFFVARGGYKPFYYKPYGYAATMKWTCKEWSASSSAPWTFNAKLEQAFTLET